MKHESLFNVADKVRLTASHRIVLSTGSDEVQMVLAAGSQGVVFKVGFQYVDSDREVSYHIHFPQPPFTFATVVPEEILEEA